MENQEWLKERTKGIGGSDAAAICGVSPYKTPLQVWEDKRGLNGPGEDNDAMFWGRTLEPVIRQRYSDITGFPVKIPTEILRHPKYEFMLGNIDGFTDEPRGIEIKTAGYPTDWGEPNTDQIPLPYIFQVQHYMAITGYPVFDVPVLIRGRDFRIYHVEQDAELQEMMIQKEAEFWEMVKSGTPPPPVNYEDVVRLYRVSHDKKITATPEIEILIDSLKKVKGDIDILYTNETEIKRIIMEFMGESDTIIDLNGKDLVSWKTANATQRFDVKALQKENPEIYRKYLKNGESSRRFLIKK